MSQEEIDKIGAMSDEERQKIIDEEFQNLDFDFSNEIQKAISAAAIRFAELKYPHSKDAFDPKSLDSHSGIHISKETFMRIMLSASFLIGARWWEVHRSKTLESDMKEK